MIKLKECSFSKLKNFLKRGKYYTYYQLFENGHTEKVMFRFHSLSFIPNQYECNRYNLYHHSCRLALTDNNFEICSDIDKVDYFYIYIGSTDDMSFSSELRKSSISEIFRYKYVLTRQSFN